MRDVHGESLTIGIDPNAPIARVSHPQDYVVQLLEYFGLTRSVLLVCGYSFGRSTPDSTDVVPDAWPDSLRGDAHIPPSGEDVLPGLAQLGARYDVALVDGHHGTDTVMAELRYLARTLRVGGLVFLDDAHDDYPGIRDVFRDPGEQFEQVGHDGRVGVLKLVR